MSDYLTIRYCKTHESRKEGSVTHADAVRVDNRPCEVVTMVEVGGRTLYRVNPAASLYRRNVLLDSYIKYQAGSVGGGN